MQRLLLIVCLLTIPMVSISSQVRDTTSVKTRKIVFASSIGTLAGGSLIGLNSIWYSQYDRTSLHSFNDNSQWLQVDKAGHAFTAYQLSWGINDLAQSAGWNKKQALWIGSGTSLAYLTAIEILDGKSAGWGFSWGDVISNAAGTSLFVTQQSIWNHQRIQLKFSYSHSEFAEVNPALLGRNFQQRIIKDYNAQTYWCSVNIHRFLASDAAFPRWMNIAFGYGATGMTRAEMNEFDVNNFRRGREYYFSFDADLNRVAWPKKWMKVTARVISFIKLPSPTIQVQSDGKVKMHALFF